MNSFTIKTEYQGVNNSQRFCDHNNFTKYSEITGYDNVRVIMELTKLNQKAAEDLSFVVSNLEEEDIVNWITSRVQEIFTIASFLKSGKDLKELKAKNKKDRKTVENYFQWESIGENPKFPYEVDDSEIDWDLPSESVLEQLYPKKYREFITKNKLFN